MAPNPIACSHRVTIPYSNDGLQHTQHLFVKATASGGGYDLIHQLSGDQPWEDDVNHWIALAAEFFKTTTLFGSCILEQYAAGEYLPVATMTPTQTTGNRSSSYAPASQLTNVFRDTAFRKVRINFMETVIGNPFHYTSLTTANADLNALLSDIISPVGDNDAGFWLRSRSEYFISSFVSSTATDNKRLRRDRNLI